MPQLYGVFIILRALFPALFVIGLYLILRRLAADVRLVAGPHLAAINAHADNVRATLAAGQTTVETIAENIGEIAEAAGDIADSLTVDLGELEIADAIDPLQLPNRLVDLAGAILTPTLAFTTKTLQDTYDVLGLQQVKDVIDNILEVMEGMATAIGIAAVSEDVGAISGQVGNLVGALFKLWLKWRRVIRAFLFLSLAFLALIYLVWLWRSLVRGFALLTGLPDPGPG